LYDSNASEILDLVESTDIVLDIGGWACPFNRANYVMDAEPYETRGFYRTIGRPAFQGGDHEYFSRDTWVRRDLCDREPYPFPDKSVDFVVCSHTLEDIRDPLWVCSEMVRIGKRGYIEFPSRLAESSRGWESDRIAGLSHHRWLIEVDEEDKDVRFTMKYHMIHSHWRYSFPPSFLRSLHEAQRSSWLFWEGGFTWSEVSLVGLDAIASDLQGYVDRICPYPPWRLRTDGATRHATRTVQRAWRKVAQRR
jgi:Methionine biosynthesis protein MetW